MRVAAYQARLIFEEIEQTISHIAKRVADCERAGVDILCCPEAVLGGLADYAPRPHVIAISISDGRLEKVLAPLKSPQVTTIVGFTELGDDGRLYNSAAVWSRGMIAGVYRKLHPAIRRSVYSEGLDLPLFKIAGMQFGIVICHDSTFDEPATLLATRGARILFIPTNNGLPVDRPSASVVAEARACDLKWAVECNLYVVRADVAGEAKGLLSYGSSEIVAPTGTLIKAANTLGEELLVADITGNLR